MSTALSCSRQPLHSLTLKTDKSLCSRDDVCFLGGRVEMQGSSTGRKKGTGCCYTVSTTSHGCSAPTHPSVCVLPGSPYAVHRAKLSQQRMSEGCLERRKFPEHSKLRVSGVVAMGWGWGHGTTTVTGLKTHFPSTGAASSTVPRPRAQPPHLPFWALCLWLAHPWGTALFSPVSCELGRPPYPDSQLICVSLAVSGLSPTYMLEC